MTQSRKPQGQEAVRISPCRVFLNGKISKVKMITEVKGECVAYLVPALSGRIPYPCHYPLGHRNLTQSAAFLHPRR